MADRLSNIPPLESLSLGKIEIGPVIDANTLARQNARTATIKITKTVADLLVKINTFLKIIKVNMFDKIYKYIDKHENH